MYMASVKWHWVPSPSHHALHPKKLSEKCADKNRVKKYEERLN
jgi:hypothetical protein